MKLAAITLIALFSAVAHAKPENTIAIVVGSNLGAAEDEPLRFAESDARRFRDLLVQLGEVEAARAVLVLGGGKEQILQALNEARGRAAELAGSGHRVSLIFYFSGHGDDDALHLSRGSLSLVELRQVIARVPADLRLTILDACRTGGRSKGVRRGPSFALATAPDEPQGSIELRASSVGEAAQESDELGGAIFTHYLISGLRGGADLDGDGRVTLAELYAYTYRRTLLQTGAASVLQHPSMQINLSGAGEVVLTKPSLASAFIEVPRGGDRYLVFAQPSDAVYGELIGDDQTRLALPASRFLVVRRAGNTASVASVDLSLGGQRRLVAADFRPIAREELLARGGRLELRPFRIEARAGAEFAPGSAEGPAVRAGLAFSYARGRLEYELEAAYVGGPYADVEWKGWVHSLTGGPSLVVRILLGPVGLSAFLGAELRYSWEHLDRVDPQRLVAAGFPATESRAFASIGPRAGLRLTLPLGHNLSASAIGAFSALFRREVAADGTNPIAFHPTVTVSAALGYAF